MINQEPLKEDNWNIIKSLKKLDSKNITIVFGLDRSNPVVHEAFLVKKATFSLLLMQMKKSWGNKMCKNLILLEVPSVHGPQIFFSKT